MSAQLNALEAKLSGVQKELDEMVNKRDAENRSFTPDEEKTFNAKFDEAQSLSEQVKTERKAEQVRQARALDKATANAKAPEQKVAERFSFAKAIRGQLSGRMDGVERELHEEAERELQSKGINTGLEGQGIPGFMLDFGKGKNILNGHKRDLSSGGTATGAEWVETVEVGHQFGLNVAPKAFGLGVEVLAGLTGNVYVTQTGPAAAVWESENSSADETTPATSKPVNLSPKRLAAFTDLSKTLLTQVGSVAEQRVRRQLSEAVSVKLDYTIFQGSGVSPIPTGIINLGGSINTVTTGGVPDRQTFLDMWAAIAADNAILGEISIATTPTIKAFLMGQPIDAGSGRFIDENDRVIGYNTIWSTNVPANYIIMGDFRQFVVGQWGGIDLVVNPFTKAKENLVELIINANFDMGCYYDKAFCLVSDATLS